MLTVSLTDADGAPVETAQLSAMVGRPTVARDDIHLELTSIDGALRAPVELAPGAWILKLEAQSVSGVDYSKRLELWVR